MQILDHLRERQQVDGPKVRAPCRQSDKRIGRSRVRPAGGQRPERSAIVVEIGAALAPGLAYGQQLEAASKQRVERMGDTHKLWFTVRISCSWQLFAKAASSAPFVLCANASSPRAPLPI